MKANGKKKERTALDVLSSEFGRRGGKALAKKKDRAYFSRLGKRGADVKYRRPAKAGQK